MNWVPPTIWFDGNSVKIDVGFRYRFASDTQSVPNWLYGFKPIGSSQRRKWLMNCVPNSDAIAPTGSNHRRFNHMVCPPNRDVSPALMMYTVRDQFIMIG